MKNKNWSEAIGGVLWVIVPGLFLLGLFIAEPSAATSDQAAAPGPGRVVVVELPAAPGEAAGNPAVLTLALRAPSAWLAWDRVADPAVTSYSLLWGTNSGQYYATNTVATNVARATGLDYSNRFFAVVTANTSNGLSSPFSAEVAFSVKAPPPLTNFTITVQPQAAPNLIGPWTNFGGPIASYSNRWDLNSAYFRLWITRSNY